MRFLCRFKNNLQLYNEIRRCLSTQWRVCYSDKADGGNGKDSSKPPEISEQPIKFPPQKLQSILRSMKVSGASDVENDSRIPLILAKPPDQRKRRAINKEKEAIEKAQMADKELIGEALVAAAKDVASSLGGDQEQTKSELLQRLKEHSVAVNKGKAPIPAKNISEMFVGMKIDRTKPSKAMASQSQKEMAVSSENEDFGSHRVASRRSDPVALQSSSHLGRSSVQGRSQSKVDLFGALPLSIFTHSKFEYSVPVSDTFQLKTWKSLEERDCKLLVSHPPRSAYEEMIRWTEQGKLWPFPIDNELGLEEEKTTPFHEHIFLERHLEVGFPRQGPIRHFMELVAIGLSKNFYLTVQDKVDHIDWFRQYFKEKEDILRESGALG